MCKPDEVRLVKRMEVGEVVDVDSQLSPPLQILERVSFVGVVYVQDDQIEKQRNVWTLGMVQKNEVRLEPFCFENFSFPECLMEQKQVVKHSQGRLIIVKETWVHPTYRICMLL